MPAVPRHPRYRTTLLAVSLTPLPLTPVTTIHLAAAAADVPPSLLQLPSPAPLLPLRHIVGWPSLKYSSSADVYGCGGGAVMAARAAAVGAATIAAAAAAPTANGGSGPDALNGFRMS